MIPGSYLGLGKGPGSSFKYSQIFQLFKLCNDSSQHWKSFELSETPVQKSIIYFDCRDNCSLREAVSPKNNINGDRIKGFRLYQNTSQYLNNEWECEEDYS